MNIRIPRWAAFALFGIGTALVLAPYLMDAAFAAEEVESVAPALSCETFATEADVVDHILAEGWLEGIPPHSWENRPPAFRGENLAAGVKVKRLEHFPARPGHIRLMDAMVSTETTYNNVVASANEFPNRSGVIHLPTGYTVDWGEYFIHTGDTYTGADWRHVAFLTDADGVPQRWECWHYYGEGLPAPTPTPEPTAEPAA